MWLQQRSPAPVADPSMAHPSPSNFDYDVAIAGGGIVGLTLASALKNSGLKVVVLEARPQSVAVSKGQAYAVSLLSSHIFQGLGLWSQILPRIATFRQIRLSDADHPGVVRFFPQDLGTEQLGYVAEHHVLLQELQTFVGQCPNVTYLCPAQVESVTYQAEGAEVHLKTPDSEQVIRTRLVVAADGARSPIRQAAGIRTHGWQYWQSCIACVIQPEHPHPDIAYERFWPSGPFAILPLPEGRCRIVWTSPHAEAQALMQLDRATFMAELQKRFGDQMGQLTLIGDPFLFPVQLMQSDRYTLPRLALVGDAAHCCHPVGGQGLNLGIRDAAALAEIIQTAHQQGQDIGDWQVLKQYERWRKQENWLILGFTDFLDRCFSNQVWPIVAIRRLGLWGLRSLQPLKVLALRLMTGLSGRRPQLSQ